LDGAVIAPYSSTSLKMEVEMAIAILLIVKSPTRLEKLFLSSLSSLTQLLAELVTVCAMLD
jgi:hypothetical protein